MPQESPTAFVWDADKADLNLQNHKIDFRDAVRVFDGPTYEVPRLTNGEFRLKATGELNGLEITVVYTPRGTEFRIISARRARVNEKEAYRAFCTLYPERRNPG